MPVIMTQQEKIKGNELKKSKLHRSFSEYDKRHPLTKKNAQNTAPLFSKLRKAHSSKAFADKSLETHIKKYKLKKKTFSEMKNLLKDFNTFYPELKRFIAHVIFYYFLILYVS